MQDRKFQFLQAVLGDDGARALAKAVERREDLGNALVPRAILSWIGIAARAQYEGPLPGLANTYISFKKSERGYNGQVAVDDTMYAFNEASLFHVASAVAVSMGIDHERVDGRLRDVDIARLGKNIDLLVGARIVTENLLKKNLEKAGFEGQGPAASPLDAAGPLTPEPPTAVQQAAPKGRRKQGPKPPVAPKVPKLALSERGNVHDHRLNADVANVQKGDGSLGETKTEVSFHEVPPNRFEEMVAKHPNQHSLDNPRTYDSKRTFLADDGSAGYALHSSGEINHVFSFVKGHGAHAVRDAVRRGGKHLTAFDGILPSYYKKFGFIETGREANWTPGGPDVVFMALPTQKSEPRGTVLKLSEKQLTKKCPACLGTQLRGDRFVGCMCWRDLAKSVNLSKNEDSTFTVSFGKNWDRDAVEAFLEGVRVKS